MTQPTRIRDLASYDNSDFDPGRGWFVRLLWYYVSLLILESGWLPISPLKVILLRCFGASIGQGVVIKPQVRIKYPWKLEIGDACWVGQEVWIDNLDQVTLENDVCLSQGAYLCTGSHDHRSPTFELQTAPILIRQGAWVACRATILSGAEIAAGQVVTAGSIVGKTRGFSPSDDHGPLN